MSRMPFHSLCFVICFSLFPTSGVRSQEQKDDRKEVISLQHVGRDTQGLTNSIGQALNGQDVRISSDPETGVIILRGSADSVARSRELVQALDQTPKIINLNVTLAISETDSGAGKLVDEFKIVSLDSSSAEVNMGSQVSVPTSRQVSGRSMVTYQAHTIGTIIKVMPRMVSGKVKLQIMVEKSWIEPSEHSSQEDQVLPPVIRNAQVESTLMLTPGESQSFRSLVGGGSKSGRVLVATVSASLGSEQEIRERAISSRQDRPARESVQRDSIRDRRRGGPPAPQRDAQPGGRSNGGRPAATESTRAADESETQADSPEEAAGRIVFIRMDANEDGRLDKDERKMLPRSLQDALETGDGELNADGFAKQFVEFIRKRSRERKSR